MTEFFHFLDKPAFRNYYTKEKGFCFKRLVLVTQEKD